jgi:glycine/serine hydroxymethyltransferase
MVRHGVAEVAKMGKLENDMAEIKAMMARIIDQSRILRERLGIIEPERKRLATIIDFKSRQVIRSRERSGQ